MFRLPHFAVNQLTLAISCSMLLGVSGIAADGSEVVNYYGYDDCIRLHNHRVRVTLCPAAGGRVLEYSLDGKNMMYLPPGDEGWQFSQDAERAPMNAGRFDIGPEKAVDRGKILWAGRWKGEVTGPRSAKLTSQFDPQSGVRLVREFHLHETTSQLRCTQTIINESRKPVSLCHWSRTFAVGDGIAVVPRSPRGRFPLGYVMYENGNEITIKPEDPNVQVDDKSVVVLDTPQKPKLGFDSHAGWLAYLSKHNHMFVKRFLTHPDRAYNEFAALTISVWYPTGGKMVELEPIGPAENLSPGEQASFTEEWWLIPQEFPKDRTSLDFGAIEKVVKASTLPAGKEPDSVVSPEVHEDGRVTFRFVGSDEHINEIRVVLGKDSFKLRRDADLVWTFTSKPMKPGWHDYLFEIDGVRVTDPRNRMVKKWLKCQSMFEIPGDEPLVTEHQTVPHGTVHRHLYASKTTGTERAAVVYTPPGYDIRADKAYPLVVLCHGFGDDETAWTEVGRTHHIMDNLIAAGKIEPMVIVMPNGHPVSLSTRTWSEDYNARNSQSMTDDIVSDLLPLVEQHYNVTDKASRRAIVGLSMGGGHSIMGGMLHPDQFSWVGAFSAAAPQGDLIKNHPDLLENIQANNQTRKLFWIACGNKDFLLDRNRGFVKRLNEHRITNTYVETEGAHNWEVWRDYLPKFLQMLFR
ncbi:MAG: alpha/beta hydrolase [Rubripirellula sp.]